jgi:hypothetical protein
MLSLAFRPPRLESTALVVSLNLSYRFGAVADNDCLLTNPLPIPD